MYTPNYYTYKYLGKSPNSSTTGDVTNQEWSTTTPGWDDTTLATQGSCDFSRNRQLLEDAQQESTSNNYCEYILLFLE